MPLGMMGRLDTKGESPATLLFAVVLRGSRLLSAPLDDRWDTPRLDGCWAAARLAMGPLFSSSCSDARTDGATWMALLEPAMIEDSIEAMV